MKYLYLSLLLLISAFGYAQTDTLKAFYKDMVMDDHRLYALSDKGKLSVWDIHSLKKLHEVQDTLYSAIAKDRNSIIHIGTKDGRLAKLNQDFSLNWYFQLKKKLQVHNIFFNSKDKFYLVVPNAVYDPVKDKYWDKFKYTERSGMKSVTIKRFLFFSIYEADKISFYAAPNCFCR